MGNLRNSRKAFFIEIVDDSIAFLLVILALVIVIVAFSGIQKADFINYKTSTVRMDASKNLNHLLSTRLSDGTVVASLLAEPTPDGLRIFEQETKAQMGQSYDQWKLEIYYPQRVPAIGDDLYELAVGTGDSWREFAVAYLPYGGGGVIRIVFMKDPISIGYLGYK